MGVVTEIFKKVLGLGGSITKASANENIIQTWSYSKFGDNIFELDTVRSCIDAIARNTSKMEFKHVVNNANGSKKVINNSDIARVLKRPNNYMSMRDFIYKCTALYYARNNCFIFPEWSDDGKLIGLHPINYQSYQIIEKSGYIFIKFVIKYTKEYVVALEDIISLKRFFYSNEFTGDDNKALIPTAELINAQNQGIINGIKNSAIIRGILKTLTVVKEEDLRKKKDEFVKDNLSMANSGGVIAIDGKYDYTPIESKAYVIDDKALSEAKKKVYDYFGVNEAFIQNSFTSEKYDAIYEGLLEPFAVMFGQALTNTLFTQTEKGYGNEIEIAMNRLKYQPISSVIQLIGVSNQIGMFTRNEYREMMGYPPVENGDEILVSLNYTKEDDVLKNKEKEKEKEKDVE